MKRYTVSDSQDEKCVDYQYSWKFLKISLSVSEYDSLLQRLTYGNVIDSYVSAMSGITP